MKRFKEPLKTLLILLLTASAVFLAWKGSLFAAFFPERKGGAVSPTPEPAELSYTASALPLAAAVFTTLLGLLANLKWHRFDWVNEASVIKQSLAPFLPVLAAFLLIGGPAVLTFLVPTLDHALVPLLTVLLFAALDAGMYALLRRNAEKWVEKL